MKVKDTQLAHLPKEIKFCKNCVVSNQRPYTEFNEHGVCSACQWSLEKDHKIDWKLREKELAELLDRHRSKDGSYDVIVPGSGGKDSAFVAHQLKYKWGMNPLCVTWAPFDWTSIGWDNLRAFTNSGFQNTIGQPDGVIHRKLAKIAFKHYGDAFVPFIFGQRSLGYKIAEKFGIKLIFFGENGSVEYGGVDKYKYQPKEEPDEWEKQYFKGAQIDQMVDIGIDENLFKPGEIKQSALQWYKAPHPQIIKDLELEMHWYSYYQKWTPQENFYYAAQYTGFNVNDMGRSESTYTKYASLDDLTDGFHFYLGYMKFGLGRCSRDAQQDIRRHHITREEAVRLVHRYDHEFPARHYEFFKKYLDIDDEFFWEVMDIYRSQSNVWEKELGKWKLKYIVE